MVSAAPRPGLQTSPRPLSGSPLGPLTPGGGSVPGQGPGSSPVPVVWKQRAGAATPGFSPQRGTPAPPHPGVPIPRDRASPKKGPPTLTRLPGYSHGPEVAKSR